MNKLILMFDDEVIGIDTCLIFNNERDVIEYLTSKGLSKITLEPTNNWFSFKTEAGWYGNGKVFWAKQF